MPNTPAKNSVISGIMQLANPVFIIIVVGLPIGALIYAMNFGSVKLLNYLHIMSGLLWTGIDLFMGAIIGPVLAGMEAKDRAQVFKRLIPKMTFLMPVLAAVATTSGIQLAQKLGWALTAPWVLTALIIAGILGLQGFGLLLPNEIRIFRQILSETADTDRIARLGMINARLAGLQGVFQVAIIVVMVNIRF
ncbi:MAG: hypothetical protein HYY80_01325 [Chloroflexi bacterium]|nr:hypothetical protein [Chloroflexota bacterium]MBI3931075.1 hypothetical protein [Chloroflexota bacterium]